MKKIFSMITLFMLCLYGMAAGTENTMNEKYRIEAWGEAGKAGETAQLFLYMTNDLPIGTWNCTLVLPEGVTFESAALVDGEDGRYPEGYNAVFTQNANDAGNEVVFSCSGAEGIGITGKEGAVAVVTVNIASTVLPGDYTVTVKDIMLIEPNDGVHKYQGQKDFTWTITEATPVAQGTIHFDLNGGEGQYADITLDVDTEVTAPEDPVREGYTFTGWEPAIPATMPEGEMTCVAQWAPIAYNITFLFDAGSDVVIFTAPLDYGTPIVAPEDPEREGYTFTGWALEDGAPVPETMPAHDVTVIAQWQINQYTITFTTGFEDVVVDPITQDYGTPVTAPEDPVKEGYKFLGWEPSVPETMPAENVECVAQWEALVEYFTPTQQYTLFSCDQAINLEGIEEVKAYIATSFNKAINYAILEQVERIPVGVGVLLVAEPGQTYTLPYHNFNEMPVYDNNLFVGVLEDTTVFPSEDGGIYNYVLGEGNNFVAVASAEGVQIPAKSAYLKMTFDGEEAPAQFNFGFDITDGITSVKMNANDGAIYDMQGRRVSQPAKGIYIVNGKKVAVK